MDAPSSPPRRAPRPGRRIACVMPEGLPFPPVKGGAVQTYALEVIRRLGEPADAPFDFTVIAPANAEAERAASGWNTRLEPVEAEEGATKEDYVAGVKRILREGHFDLVHVWNRPEFVPACKEAGPGRRVLLNLHNDHLNRGVDRATALRCVEVVERVVTNGEYLRETTERGFPALRGRVECVASGVDASLFRPANTPGERAAAREALGIPRGAPVILYAGRLRKTKGVHLLLRAVRGLRREFPDLLLVLAGASWFGEDSEETRYTRKLRAMAEGLRRDGKDPVRFLGYVPYGRMPEVFRAADVFAAPALWNDPFPRTNLEAMSSGLPVVSTRRGGIPEIVRPGETGVLVPFHRLAFFHARAIRRLLREPAQAALLGQRGRMLVERRYTWGRTAAGIAEEYRSLL